MKQARIIRTYVLQLRPNAAAYDIGKRLASFLRVRGRKG